MRQGGVNTGDEVENDIAMNELMISNYKGYGS
jgi:hypothetical protein